MTLDVDRVRAAFPAMDLGVAHFDGPGGSQVPRVVADAVARTLVSGIGNRGAVTDAERRADDAVLDARAAVADLLGADPGGVVFGRSMTQITYDVARALATTWAPGDEVVVTRLDHDANIRPWVRAAELAGATVRWAPFDRATGELDPQEVAGLVGERTRLVAVTGASNLLGTRPDVAAVSEAAHAAGALVYVDGVHLTPHAPIDVAALGADFFACSPYKFFGPHLGVLVARPRSAGGRAPGQAAAVDRRGARAVRAGHPALRAAGRRHRHRRLHRRPGPGLRQTAGLGSWPRWRPSRQHEDRALRPAGCRAARDRPGSRCTAARPGTPPLCCSRSTASHRREVYEQLGAAGVNAPAGSFYALEASRWMGLGDSGAVRAGLAPYTDYGDVDRLLAGVAQLSG